MLTQELSASVERVLISFAGIVAGVVLLLELPSHFDMLVTPIFGLWTLIFSFWLKGQAPTAGNGDVQQLVATHLPTPTPTPMPTLTAGK